MRKGIVIIVIFLFIGLSILPSIVGQYKEEKKNFFTKLIINSSFNLDELDQEQPWCWQGGAIIYDCQYYAQAFKPTLNRLTRVELALQGDKNETSTLSDLTISIRKNLTGDDLTSVIIPIEDIGPFLHLMSVNFPDISVIPETTYYIVARTTGGGWDGNYWWSYCQQETYNRGHAWKSSDCGSSWYLLNFGGGNNNDWAAFIFRTYGYNVEKNNPPYMPSNPYPEDGAKNISTDIVLNWTGGDPDVEDIVTYDIYFGSILTFKKIASNMSNTSINLGNLDNGLTYFWSIVAWDNHGLSSEGPVWEFTTIQVNNPPNKPIITGQTNGQIGVEYEYKIYIEDPDGDDVDYYVDFDDGDFIRYLGYYFPSPLIDKFNKSWDSKGTYTVRAKAMDKYGAVSDWGILKVSIPKSYIYNPITELLVKIVKCFPFFEKILNQIV